MSNDDRMQPSRRRFIISAVTGLAAAATFGAYWYPSNGNLLAGRLSQTVLDPIAARRFGQAYLLINPDEAGIDPLVDRIDKGLIEEFGQGLNLDDPQLLAEHLDAQIRNEYRRCDAIQVDGWALSRTEARLYALLTML